MFSPLTRSRKRSPDDETAVALQSVF